MALPATTVMEVRTGGSDTANGGGFVTGASGTDRSQQDAVHATLTTASVVNSTTTKIDVDAGDHAVVAADVGNIYQNTGGTSTAGFYRITAVDTVASPKTWTLDRSIGTAAQTVAGGMGGGLATPGMLGKFLNDHGVKGMHGWMEAGTYTLTSASANVAGGTFTPKSDTEFQFEGYQTTRGDRGTAPVVAVNAQTSITVMKANGTFSTNPHRFINIKVDGNSQSSIVGFDLLSPRHAATLCQTLNCTTGFASTAAGASACYSCEAVGGTLGFDAMSPVNCTANGCTTGFANGETLISSNSAYGCVTGFAIPARARATKCTAANCSGDGFTLADASYVFDCLAALNGGYGFNAGSDDAMAYNCYGHSNTSGNSNGLNSDEVTDLTVDPFVDETTDDYRLNDTASGGAVVRSAGFGVFGQTDNQDIGAVQHTDPAGGGGGIPFMIGM